MPLTHALLFAGPRDRSAHVAWNANRHSKNLPGSHNSTNPSLCLLVKSANTIFELYMPVFKKSRIVLYKQKIGHQIDIKVTCTKNSIFTSLLIWSIALYLQACENTSRSFSETKWYSVIFSTQVWPWLKILKNTTTLRKNSSIESFLTFPRVISHQMVVANSPIGMDFIHLDVSPLQWSRIQRWQSRESSTKKWAQQGPPGRKAPFGLGIIQRLEFTFGMLHLLKALRA